MLHLILALQVVASPVLSDAIAVVNIQRLLAESLAGKAAAAKVDALRAEKEKTLAEKQAAIDAAVKQGVPAHQLQRMRLNFQRSTEDADRDVADLSQSVQADFAKRLRPILQKLIEEDHVGVTIEVPNALVLWVHPSVDLTPKVIERLDAAEPRRRQRDGHGIDPAAARPCRGADRHRRWSLLRRIESGGRRNGRRGLLQDHGHPTVAGKRAGAA